MTLQCYSLNLDRVQQAPGSVDCLRRRPYIPC